jgi:hypothetical protein
MTPRRRRPVPWQQKPLFPGSADTVPRESKPSVPPRYQFGQVPKWLTRLNPPPRVHQLWNLLAEYAHGKGTGKCWPGQDVLAERMNCSVRTVQRYLGELETLGAVTSQFWSAGRQGRLACVYTLYFQGPYKRPTEEVPTRQPVRSYTTTSAFLHDNQCSDFGPPSDSAQLAGARRNQTQVTKLKEPRATSSLNTEHSHSTKTVSHHHQGPALTAPDDDAQVSDNCEKIDTCLGPDQEAQDHMHATEGALARHLELFLAHTFAHRFVREHGVHTVNQALRELVCQRGLKSEVAWLVTRVGEIRNGAGELPRPTATLQETQQKKHLRDYYRRWGRYPEGEGPE